MKASSTRLNDVEKIGDLTTLSRESFKQAATFASCCLVGQSAATIMADFQKWWADVGREMLFGEDLVEEDLEDDYEEDSSDIFQRH